MLTELSLLIERGSELALQMISLGRKKSTSKRGIYTPQSDNAIYQINSTDLPPSLKNCLISSFSAFSGIIAKSLDGKV